MRALREPLVVPHLRWATGSARGPGGAVYVVTGSASQTGGGSLNHPAMVKGFNERGSVLVEADPYQLKVDFVTEGGEVKDSFRLTKPAC